nr:ricin-type beta-trefoil lectin domain protein [Actinospica acidithermotolerans]
MSRRPERQYGRWQMQIWGRNGRADQTWTHTSSGQLTVTNNGMSDCLDANVQGTVPGTKVIIWPCNGQSNQQWQFDSDGTVTGVQSGLRLDVTGASTADGALSFRGPRSTACFAREPAPGPR